jgi:YVTN family beta-propeller protein
MAGSKNKSQAGLLALRLMLGIFFLFEGIDKAAWLTNPSLLVTNSLQNWARTGTAVSRWYVETVCIPGAPVFARLIFLGEVATGIALILGLWTRAAAAIAFVMVLNIHFAHSSIFRFGFLSQGDGLPVLGGLLALAIGGHDMRKRLGAIFGSCLFVLAGCSSTPPEQPPAADRVAAPSPEPGYRVYVTSEVSGELSVIDPGTLEVISTVMLGKRPRGIHASPDGKLIYVALSGSPIAGPGVDESKLPPADKTADGIGVFDVLENKVVRIINAGSDPEEFDLSKDGSLLYASNEDVGGASIVDIAAGKIVQTLKVGDEPEGVTTSPDGRFVYVTSEDAGTISVIDTAATKVIKTFNVGHRPRDVAFMPDGTKAYATRENDAIVSIIDVAKHEPSGEIQLGQAGVIKPMSVVLSPDASKLFVSTGRGKMVSVIDTTTDKVIGSFEAGTRPWGIGVSPDGKMVYTANGPSNDVSVIDVEKQMVVKTIPVSGSPWGILILK